MVQRGSMMLLLLTFLAAVFPTRSFMLPNTLVRIDAAHASFAAAPVQPFIQGRSAGSRTTSHVLQSGSPSANYLDSLSSNAGKLDHTDTRRSKARSQLVHVPQKNAGVVERLTGAFPFWVLGAALIGFAKPAAFTWFDGNCITAALATTMLFMGTTLSVNDFKAIAKQPKPVTVGTALQYTVMPLLGFVVSKLFKLSPALTAGVILVGTCPGGTASNLVALIAGADVALSVMLTAASTLLATLLTPLLTRALIGGVVEVSARQLVISTAQVVFAPVALGLLLATKARHLTQKVERIAPLFCVALVACICGSVVASNAAAVAACGAKLLAAVACMHMGGFALGYISARKAGLGERAARTVSIEVGMQNSSLAVVLAKAGFADPLVALPGAISATVHSLLGSALAAYWRTKPVAAEDA